MDAIDVLAENIAGEFESAWGELMEILEERVRENHCCFVDLLGKEAHNEEISNLIEKHEEEIADLKEKFIEKLDMINGQIGELDTIVETTRLWLEAKDE